MMLGVVFAMLVKEVQPLCWIFIVLVGRGWPVLGGSPCRKEGLRAGNLQRRQRRFSSARYKWARGAPHSHFCARNRQKEVWTPPRSVSERPHHTECTHTVGGMVHNITSRSWVETTRIFSPRSWRQEAGPAAGLSSQSGCGNYPHLNLPYIHRLQTLGFSFFGEFRLAGAVLGVKWRRCAVRLRAADL